MTRVTLSFPHLEAIVGVPLPPAAGIVAWWPHTPSRGGIRPWRAAGWRAA
jgi:hypothetical protein